METKAEMDAETGQTEAMVSYQLDFSTSGWTKSAV